MTASQKKKNSSLSVKQSNALVWFSRFLIVGSVAISILPYDYGFGQMFLSWEAWSPLYSPFFRIPFTLFVWGTGQLIELQPLFISLHEGYLRKALEEAGSHIKSASDASTPEVAWLQKNLDRLKVLPIREARFLSAFVYALDVPFILWVRGVNWFNPVDAATSAVFAFGCAFATHFAVRVANFANQNQKHFQS